MNTKRWKISTFVVINLIFMGSVSLSCSTIRLLGSTISPATTVTPTTTSTVTPTETYTPTSTNLPRETIVGKWFFTVYGDPWESLGLNKFFIIYNEDGTLVHKYKETDEGTGGIWTQTGESIHFEINEYSFWDGIVEGEQMSGSVYNNDGESGTWSAIYQQ